MALLSVLNLLKKMEKRVLFLTFLRITQVSLQNKKKYDLG